MCVVGKHSYIDFWKFLWQINYAKLHRVQILTVTSRDFHPHYQVEKLQTVSHHHPIINRDSTDPQDRNTALKLQLSQIM